MKRIGVMGHDFIAWGGGLDFIRMVCASLHASGEAVELHLLLPVRGPNAFSRGLALRLQSLLARARGRGTVRSFAPSRARILESVADTGGEVRVHFIDAGQTALLKAYRGLSLDVLLPAFGPPRHSAEMAWVGYLYDFQHQHLPHLFSQAERDERDRSFGRLLDSAQVVIANARAVAQDAQRFRPQARARIVALPFSAAPAPAWFGLDVAAARARHGLRKPYFIVCNQFWIHKDHRTAIAAFAQAAGNDPDIQLVCTGATSDYRHPAHFDDLMRLASERGVRDRVHVLGLIPKPDQIALVRGALALVQPTLSEGGPGGGAVYDAVSLGVPALVSDIAVNREIDEPGVSFFRAGDAEDLARAMRSARDAPPAPRLDGGELLRRGQLRRQRCGLALLQAVELARK